MINIQNLAKKFGSKKILNNLSYQFTPSKLTAIIGPSGSGKTTLIRCIIGLEKIDYGHIFFSNIPINEKNRKVYNRKIGMVFQNCELFPHMNAIDNVTYAPISLKLANKNDAHDRATELFNKFGIGNKTNIMPSSLSGGQKQKVAIIRTLMTDPSVIIFDEPTSALDPESIQDLVNMIEEIKNNLTIILVTHHLSFAKQLADDVIFMDQGHILCSQTKEEFFRSPDSVRAKLFLDAVGKYL